MDAGERRGIDYHTAADIARLLDVTTKTVFQWYHQGYIEGYRVGPRLLRFPITEAEKMVNRRELPKRGVEAC